MWFVVQEIPAGTREAGIGEETAGGGRACQWNFDEVRDSCVRARRLIDAADQAFQVACFGEREDLGMVGGCCMGFEQLHAAVGVDGCGGDDFCELL